MTNVTLEIFETFYFCAGIQSLLLQVTLNVHLEQMNIRSTHPTQILLTLLLSIGHSSKCILKVYIKAHTKEKRSTTNR